jgi:hypothetical protein
VDKPLRPCDDDDDCRLIENCGIKEAKRQWEVEHPPQNIERAVLAQASPMVAKALLLPGKDREGLDKGECCVPTGPEA